MKYRLYVMNKLSKMHPYVWIGIIILFALILRLYHITYPLNDAYAWRQTQTAGLIRDYYRNGINMLYPSMITLGEPGYVVLEFPLYQALSAILYNVFVPGVIISRFVSIFFGLLSIVFIYRLCIKFLDNKSALLACLFYGFMPLNIFFQRVPMPDPLIIFLSLAMLDLLIEGIRGKRLPLILGIIAAATGLVMKSPYIAPLYLPLMYVSYRHGGIGSLIKPRFLAALFIPLTIMLIWQGHANYVNDIYFNTDAYPFKELYKAVVVKFKPINTWYFGTIEQRTQLQNYKILWGRLYREILSGFGLIFLATGVFTLIRKKEGKFFYIWLFAVFVSIMVFFNLHVVHSYYQLPLAAVLSVFCGAGAAYLVELIRNKGLIVAVLSVIIILNLYSSWSFTEKHLFWEDPRDYIKVGQFIDNSTEKNALIGISTPDNDVWEPTYMYYADRHGFVVPHGRLNKDMIEYLKSKNIRYLAITDYSNIYDAVVKLLYPYKIRAYNRNVIIYDIQTLQKYDIEISRKIQFYSEKEQIHWNKMQKIKGGRHSIDRINELINPWRQEVQPVLVDISKNNILAITGWAVDEKTEDIAHSVYITLDDKPVALAIYGGNRPDVAKFFKIEQYRLSGWRASIGLDGIVTGIHKISLRIVAKDKKSYYEPEYGSVLVKVVKDK